MTRRVATDRQSVRLSHSFGGKGTFVRVDRTIGGRRSVARGAGGVPAGEDGVGAIVNAVGDLWTAIPAALVGRLIRATAEPSWSKFPAAASSAPASA